MRPATVTLRPRDRTASAGDAAGGASGDAAGDASGGAAGDASGGIAQLWGPLGMKGPPAHPSELTCPCCLPALGEFSEMTPYEGSGTSLTQGAIR